MASILQVGLVLGIIQAAGEVSHSQPQALQVPLHTPGGACQAATQNSYKPWPTEPSGQLQPRALVVPRDPVWTPAIFATLNTCA